MKKAYTKPEIVFENFSLSTCIASCEVKTNTPSAMQCAYGETEFGLSIFLDTVSACESWVQDGANNTFCYNVPVGTYNLFNS